MKKRCFRTQACMTKSCPWAVLAGRGYLLGCGLLAPSDA